ncbi:hypothetical protein TNCV_1738371 [Trichonephila clavipes]|nr:hypothetical protein TNCV_1738371 [Trichonephila clavipes]
MIKLEEKLKQLQANYYMLQLCMETRNKTFSNNIWSFGWPWLGTHVYKMTPTVRTVGRIDFRTSTSPDSDEIPARDVSTPLFQSKIKTNSIMQ